MNNKPRNTEGAEDSVGWSTYERGAFFFPSVSNIQWGAYHRRSQKLGHDERFASGGVLSERAAKQLSRGRKKWRIARG